MPGTLKAESGNGDFLAILWVSILNLSGEYGVLCTKIRN
jgi:hypothetical protein